MNNLRLTFPACGEAPLGLYPVVETAEWVEFLIAHGVTTIQLRIKDKPFEVVEQEILNSIAATNGTSTRLFINDYWQLAINHGAYGVHLGQDDLDTADLAAISQAGLRLGVSTQCENEVDRALSINPSYIAFGPIYHTTSKEVSCAPRGLGHLRHWCEVLDYPVVAIGGISAKNFEDVLETGVAGIAMISAITLAEDPSAVVKHFLNYF